MTLYSEQLGQGPAVVFLHGWGLHAGLFQSVASELAADYRCVLVDLPGHGRSPMSADSYSIEQAAQQVAELVPDDAVIVGWSLGGLIAAQLALSFPDKVKKLFLVTSSPRFITGPDWPHAIKPDVLQSFATELEQDYETVLMRFLALTARGSQQVKDDIRNLRDHVFEHGRPDVNGLRSGLEILETTDLRASLDRLHMPVAYLLGAHDMLVPARLCGVLSKLQPHAQCHVIAGAGHAPFLSHKDEFVRLARQFMANG